MGIQYKKVNVMPNYENWTYGIQEISPGAEQVELYRDGILRFTAPIVTSSEKMLVTLLKVVVRMEFDIQRKISRRLYGFDAVRSRRGIFADMANEDVRSFLVSHAVSLKRAETPDCGISTVDVVPFLDVVEKAGKQILSIESYKTMPLNGIISQGEKWRIDDMRTPTPFLLSKNLAEARRAIEAERMILGNHGVYSFIIDCRDVSSDNIPKISV